MGEAVGTDPLPENVGGSIVEEHSWSHEVHHTVQWDYVLIAVVALLVAWWLFGGESEGVDVDRSDDDDTPFSG